jgi:transcriptional regulator with PAS, ATPase and Fis domain
MSGTPQGFTFDRVIGRSVELRQAIDVARRVAQAPTSTVLLVGETGTGKEMFARGIHYEGRNAAAPFVAINCAAIPDTLLESELFGHEAGAFTGARTRKLGLMELAGCGTLFLD